MYYPNLRTVGQTVAFHAAKQPAQAAIVCQGRQVSYRTLHRESSRSAHAILAAGLARGSRVAYLGKESEHYYEILFACAKSQTVLVPVNWRLTGAEIDHILRDSGAELILAEHEFMTALPGPGVLPRLRAVIEADAPGTPGSGFQAWKEGHSTEDPGLCSHCDDPVAQLYTSGTTGLPKGVVLAHRSFFTIRDALAEGGLD